jgi:4-diphosphocytidyl-2-C-methyl-D-erythritol kinase
MISYPNAKINLGLNITEKRPDGYHTIESVLYPVPLCDMLEITIASDGLFSFESSGLSLDCDIGSNLCVAAYDLLHQQCNIPPVKIWLHKVIPPGAGLGGGSADAAFTLNMLNNLCNLDLNKKELKELATNLGMDCPFFIDNQPALATGRGDVLAPLDLSLQGHSICIVRPDIHISTAKAYAGVTPHSMQPSPSSLVTSSVSTWEGILKNQFEETLFIEYPQLQSIKDILYDSGAVYSSLSGSGSAVYGIFNTVPRLQSKFEDMFYWEGNFEQSC